MVYSNKLQKISVGANEDQESVQGVTAMRLDDKFCYFVIFSTLSMGTFSAAFARDLPPHAERLLNQRRQAIESSEQDLISQFDIALKLNGDSSPVTFERFLDLLKVLVQLNSEEALANRADEISKRFSALAPNEQQYFALKLLELANKATREKKYSIGSIFYEPIVAKSMHPRWENRAEISLALSEVATALGDRDRLIEADKLRQAACRVSDSGPVFDVRAHRLFANSQFRLKMYNKAASEFEKVLQAKGQRSDCHDLVSLAKCYENLDELNKLAALCQQIVTRIHTLDTEDEILTVAAVVPFYTTTGLTQQSEGIILSLLHRVQDLSFDIPHQWSSVMSIVVSTPYGEKPQPDVQSMYKIWTDLVKKKYGASSLEWMDAMDHRFSTDIPSSLQAEQEIQDSKIQPGSVAQRIAFIALLSKFSHEKKSVVAASLNQFTRDVPTDQDTPLLFNRAGNLYFSLEMKDECRKCQLEAVRSLTISANDLWWRPYLQKLAEGACERFKNSSFRILLEAMVSSANESRSQREDLIDGELSREGSEADYKRFVKQRQLADANRT